MITDNEGLRVLVFAPASIWELELEEMLEEILIEAVEE